MNLQYSDWGVIQGEISALYNWLTEDNFEKIFSDLIELTRNETVFVFEAFKRIYKPDNEVKRLSDRFHLN